MEYRTFYDRAEKKIDDHKQRISNESVVKPNLSLSVKEIYDRWQRNEPLDVMLRNGEFDIPEDVDEDSINAILDGPDGDEDIDIGAQYQSLFNSGQDEESVNAAPGEEAAVSKAAEVRGSSEADAEE